MTGAEQPGRPGRRAKHDGLVRPYVVDAGGHGYRRPTQRDADGPMLDGTGDLGPGRARNAGPEPKRRYGPPWAAAAPPPAENVTGSHRASPPDSRLNFSFTWPGPPGERRWLVAIGGVAALAIVGGMILFLSRPSSKLLASVCQARTCHQGVTRSLAGVQPPAGGPAAMPRVIHPRHRTATQPYTAPTSYYPAPSPTSSAPTPQPTTPSAKPTSPRPSPTSTTPSSSPTSTPTSTPTSSPTPQAVHVSYALVDQWDEGFHGRFTIVNNGSTAINGWQLAVALPDDHIQRVWDGSFHTGNGTVYIDPSSSQQTIAPGATITEDFIAHGSTTAPTSCTFNGSAC